MKRERETCGLWEAERGTRKRIPAPADPQPAIPHPERFPLPHPPPLPRPSPFTPAVFSQ